MTFDPGFDIRVGYDPLSFAYGKGVYGPEPEYRSLDAIRQSLLDPDCDGPDPVYCIAMDTGKVKDKDAMVQRDLLYGVVTYSKGLLGKEPVRSQGHIHAVSASCGMSTPEVYEIWSGSAYIYMQETADDDPGRCFAILCNPGDVVMVPPGWAHATFVADTSRNLTFGAWCVRDYGFDYKGVRAHHGLAWFPEVQEDGSTKFLKNTNYPDLHGKVEVRGPRSYEDFGIEKGKPIYTQFEEDPDKWMFVSKPQRYMDLWKNYRP